jgi:hypothetical protein
MHATKDVFDATCEPLNGLSKKSALTTFSENFSRPLQAAKFTQNQESV